MNKKQVKSLVEKSRKELTQQREYAEGLRKMLSITENKIAFDEYNLKEMESMLKESAS